MRQLLRQIKIQQTNFAREREEESVVVDNEVVWSIYQRCECRELHSREDRESNRVNSYRSEKRRVKGRRLWRNIRRKLKKLEENEVGPG